MSKKIENQMLVLFGATGDLTKRKLIPALYKLYANKRLNNNIPIICVSRRDLTKEAFIKSLELKKFILKADKKILKKLLDNIYYYSLNFVKTSEENLNKFCDYLSKLDKKYKCKNNKSFYMAISPQLFRPVSDIIKKSCLKSSQGWKKVIFEKPFGWDLKSARQINKHISKLFKEKEIFRIDHYLGKELVENILVFRFANAIYEQIWHKEFIDHIQITVAEKVGVGFRGGYYDKAGALRDMVQNHILQVLSLTTMGAPLNIDANNIRDQKVKILKSLRNVKSRNIVLGQYSSYRKEKGVDSNSQTETFAAMKMFIDHPKWKNIPIYIRTGKMLKNKYAEVNLILKDVTCNYFCREKIYYSPNVVTIRIQPDDGIGIRFNTKIPGPEMKLIPVYMTFCEKCKFGIGNTPEAYEILLHEIMRGDQTLFTRWDGVEESWKFVDPILRMVKNKRIKLQPYKAGTMGPKTAEDLIKRDGRDWLELEKIGITE